jgi:hypothetical protein
MFSPTPLSRPTKSTDSNESFSAIRVVVNLIDDQLSRTLDEHNEPK